MSLTLATAIACLSRFEAQQKRGPKAALPERCNPAETLCPVSERIVGIRKSGANGVPEGLARRAA
jgi:hypothetical protein